MYKKVLSVLGMKGGVGKTTTSHLLAHGLSKLGVRTVLITTDSAAVRLSLNDENRAYTTFSAQTEENMVRALKIFQNLDATEQPAIMIADGGGNRPAADLSFSKFSDLIILPFRDSPEDVRVVSEDLRRLEDSVGLPSCWPTNYFAQTHASAIMEKMEKEFPGRIMQPFPAMRATQNLLLEEFTGVNNEVTNLAKRLAEAALNRMGINPFAHNLVNKKENNEI